jgi:hypothetical protein
MSAFLTSLGVVLKQIFHPDTPGPIRNEIQRAFGLALGGVLRNRRLCDGVNERADANEKRRRIKDKRMTTEEQAELVAVTKRLEDGIKKLEGTEVARQADAEKTHAELAAKRKTVKNEAERARLATRDAAEREAKVAKQLQRVDEVLKRLELERGLSLEWDEDDGRPDAR